MEENSDFLKNLEAAIEKKKESIEIADLPKLKEFLGIFQTYFENIYNILIRKSLIQEDPYKYDEKISEVTVPSGEPILEMEKQDEISKRLSSFHAQLEFLNNYYQFSFEFITLKRIKNITGLVNYINWMNLSPGSSHIMTRTLGELAAKIKMGGDNISAQILADSLGQMERVNKEILVKLETVINFLREAYKFKLRRDVVSKIEMNAKLEVSESIKVVKREFPKYLKNESFYPELVQEIILENNSENKDFLQKEVFKKLSVEEKKESKKDKKKTHKAILLHGLRILASSGFQLEDVITKLNENNLVYTSRKMSFGEKIDRWIKKILQGKEDSNTYEIEYFDVSTSSTKTEKVNFEDFIDELRKKSKIFASVSSKTSAGYVRLEGAAENQVYDFLEKNLSGLQLIHRRLSGFNEFFKTQTPAEKKSKIRSITLELTAVKNSLVNSNKKKHEYTALKEEQEQMKRLGIKTDESH